MTLRANRLILTGQMNVLGWSVKCVRSMLYKLSSVLRTLTTRTHFRRWQIVAFAGRPPWDARNEIIASFIPAGSSVIDLGCGAQTLKTYLPHGCEYQPCDLIKSSPQVIVCDFNAGIYPETATRFSHVVCSGVMEYIRDHRRFLLACGALGDAVILSYNPRLPGDSRLQRMTNNWINHFTRSQLEQIFTELGFLVECLHIAVHGEIIYKLTSR